MGNEPSLRPNVLQLVLQTGQIPVSIWSGARLLLILHLYTSHCVTTKSNPHRVHLHFLKPSNSGARASFVWHMASSEVSTGVSGRFAVSTCVSGGFAVSTGVSGGCAVSTGVSGGCAVSNGVAEGCEVSAGDSCCCSVFGLKNVFILSKYSQGDGQNEKNNSQARIKKLVLQITILQMSKII